MRKKELIEKIEDLEKQVASLQSENFEMFEEMQKHKSLYDYSIDVKKFLQETKFYNELEPEERKDFLGKASQVYQNLAFDKVIDDQMNKLTCHYVLQASNEEKRNFDRGGVRALQTLKEEFANLNNLFDQVTAGEEPFDKYKPT